MCGNPNSRLLSRFVIDFLLLICIYGLALLVLPQTLRTQQNGFHCQDATLRYPYRQSAVTKVHLSILIIALPAASILVVELLRAAFVKRSAELKPRFVFVGARIPTFVSECYKIIGVYLFGLALTLIVTRTSKHWTGRLRPYFHDVCQPSWWQPDGDDAQNATRSCPPLGVAYIDTYTCNEFGASAELLAIVRHSFPSGFAATTTYAMTFLIAYAQVRLYAPWLRLPRTALQFACFALAAFVALERVASFQNHTSDVCAGVALGAALAVFVAVFVAHLFRGVRVKRSQWARAEQIYGYAGCYSRSTYGF